jgi:homoserine dehydrogenase
MKVIGIGLLGCGTVGAHVADRLARDRDAIESRTGARCELRAIAVRDLRKRRPDSLDRGLFTTNAWSIVEDPRVDVIIELIGGVREAGALIKRALQHRRHTVTANKDLLATAGGRLQSIAAAAGTSLRFDGAVGGAIPILRTIEDALAGDEIASIAGIVNGTCTAILSQLEHGIEFDAALARAQALGYAEADPSNDVEGIDSAHKLALIVQHAFGLAADSGAIRRRGIAGIAARDLERAARIGLRLRLVAATVRTRQGVFAEVAPVLVHEDHEFARTSGAQNVVTIESRSSGPLILRGQGAGGEATAASVLGDLIATLRSIGNPAAVRPLPRVQPAGHRLEPFFDALPRTAELPGYPIWNDAAIEGPLRARASA